MTYTPKNWRDYPNTSTPITASELNRIEEGIRDARPKRITTTVDILELPPGQYVFPGASGAALQINGPKAADGEGYVDPATLTILGSTPGVRTFIWTTIPAVSSSRHPVTWVGHHDSIAWSGWSRVEGSRLTAGFDVHELATGVYYSATSSWSLSAINGPGIPHPAIIVVRRVTNTFRIIDWYQTPNVSLPDPPKVYRKMGDGANLGDWREITPGIINDDGTLESLELASSLATEGEQAGIRRLLQGFTEEENPVWSWWGPVGERLNLPTHDDVGQAMHPSVVRVPGGWNGYEYWMAHTPYPNYNDSHEDPNIICSHDGDNWVVPAGLTNPIDDAPGGTIAHNSDTQLILVSGALYCTWRMVDRNDNNRNIIYYSRSTDGSTWTPKREVYRGAVAGTSNRTMVSQSLISLGSNQWRLYFIESIAGENLIVFFEGVGEGGFPPNNAQWTNKVVCETGERNPFRDPWHSEVRRYDGKYYILFGEGNRDTTGRDSDLYFGMSDDGVSWDLSPLPVIPRVSEGLTSQYKAGFVLSGSGSNLEIDLYYSGLRRSSRKWGTYRTTVKRLPQYKAASPWIDLTSLLTDATADYVRAKRVGGMVTLDIQSLVPTEDYVAGKVLLEALPRELQPGVRRNLPIPTSLSGDLIARSGFIFPNGSFGIWGNTDNVTINFTVTWPADN